MLGDILTAILPRPAANGQQTNTVRGPLHRAIYGAIAGSGYPLTVWDIKQALKRSGAVSAVDAGSLHRCLGDLTAAGLVQFVGNGYQLRNGGRR